MKLSGRLARISCHKVFYETGQHTFSLTAECLPLLIEVRNEPTSACKRFFRRANTPSDAGSSSLRGTAWIGPTSFTILLFTSTAFTSFCRPWWVAFPRKQLPFHVIVLRERPHSVQQPHLQSCFECHDVDVDLLTVSELLPEPVVFLSGNLLRAAN